MEDGREIFDEWENGETENTKVLEKKRRKKDSIVKEVAQSSKLTKYLKKDQEDPAAGKKETNIGSDALLANILTELGGDSKVGEMKRKTYGSQVRIYILCRKFVFSIILTL